MEDKPPHLAKNPKARNFTIRLSADEYEAIRHEAAMESAPSVSAYARAALLKEDRSESSSVKRLQSRMRLLESKVNKLTGEKV